MTLWLRQVVISSATSVAVSTPIARRCWVTWRATRASPRARSAARRTARARTCGATSAVSTVSRRRRRAPSWSSCTAGWPPWLSRPTDSRTRRDNGSWAYGAMSHGLCVTCHESCITCRGTLDLVSWVLGRGGQVPREGGRGGSSWWTIAIKEKDESTLKWETVVGVGSGELSSDVSTSAIVAGVWDWKAAFTETRADGTAALAWTKHSGKFRRHFANLFVADRDVM